LETLKEIVGLVPWGWIVAFVLGILAIRALKPSVHRFLDRANKFKAGSFAAEAPPQQISTDRSLGKEDAIEVAATSGSYEEYQKAIQPFRFAAMNKRVEKVRKEVDFQQFTIEQLREILPELAGLVLMAVDFENLYNLIFGSQIFLLQDLNAVYATGRPLERAKQFYENAVKTFPPVYENYSFDQWLDFLVNSGVVIREPNSVKITEEGRDFLRYLVQVGKEILKQG